MEVNKFKVFFLIQDKLLYKGSPYKAVKERLFGDEYTICEYFMDDSLIAFLSYVLFNRFQTIFKYICNSFFHPRGWFLLFEYEHEVVWQDFKTIV